MRIRIEEPGSDKMRSLIAAKGVQAGGIVEWDVVTPQAGDLTPAEIAALQRKHKSPNPNLARAVEVKRFMRQGKTCKEIKIALRRKYGARMIEADHATLSRSG